MITANDEVVLKVPRALPQMLQASFRRCEGRVPTLRPTAAAASAASILDGIGVSSDAEVTESRRSGGTWVRETAVLTRTLLFSVPPQTTVPEAFLHNLSDDRLVQCAVDLRRAAELRVAKMLRQDHGSLMTTGWPERSEETETRPTRGPPTPPPEVDEFDSERYCCEECWREIRGKH